MMERGDYGGSMGLDGHRNGATLAYLTYTAVLLVCAASCSSIQRKRTGPPGPKSASPALSRMYIQFVFLFGCVCLLVMLFGFGGIRVLSGEIGKGEFRVGLGRFGAVAYWLTKFIMPGLLAYGACLYKTMDRTLANRMLWWSACGAAFVVGITWGYKTSGALMLLPALLILFWETTITRLTALAIVLVTTTAGLFFWFGEDKDTAVPVLQFFWYRVTVLQGDVAWLVWDHYTNGTTFPPYAKTLVTIGGDKLFSLVTDIHRSNIVAWAEYHYDFLLNSVAGIPAHITAQGHSITATPFAEGVIAGGLAGMVLFGALAGVIIGFMHRALSNSIQTGRTLRTALLSTYFCWVVFPWLIGGAVHQLVHIATGIGIVLACLAILAVRYLSILALDLIATRGARILLSSRKRRSWAAPKTHAAAPASI